jgi:type III secretory pathway component EscU
VFGIMTRLLAPLSAAALIAMIVSVTLILGPVFTCPSIFPDGARICPPIESVSVLFGVLLLFAGIPLAVFAWVLGLIIAARHGQWVWFVLILVLNVFGVLAYASLIPTTIPDGNA